MLAFDFFSINWKSLASFEDYISAPTSLQNPSLNAHVELQLQKALEGHFLSKNEELFSEHSSFFNPILIKGSRGVGKSHVLEAMIAEIHKMRPDLKIAFIKGNTFIALLDSISQRKNIMEKLYTADVFVFDDIHLLAKDSAVQENFVELFDFLIHKGKCVILSLVKNNQEEREKFFLSQEFVLTDSLLSRLNLGLVVNLPLPDLDIRMRYVEMWSRKFKLKFKKSMSLTLARFTPDMRKLQGVLKTIAFNISLSPENSLFTEEDLREFLETFEEKIHIDSDSIMTHTANYFNVEVEELKGKSRVAKIVLARQVSMYLCRKLLAFSYPRIAQIYEGKDHTTIMYACQKVEKEKNLQSIASILTKKIFNS